MNKIILVSICIMFYNCNKNRFTENKLGSNIEDINADTIKDTLQLEHHNDNRCIVPKKVKEYLKKNNIKLYSEKDLVNEWRTNPNADTITCPTIINTDITNDNHEDFICIIDYYDKKYQDSFPALVIFKNYKEENILNPMLVSGVKDYMENGIGTAIINCNNYYKGKQGICVDNFESSFVFVYWNGEGFTEEYIGD